MQVVRWLPRILELLLIIIKIIIMDILYKDCQIVKTNAKALLDEEQTKRKNKNKKR